ncbi:MAG: molybdate ABC transporter permease subunit [Planctomycetota bacterium]|nr:molybdate ABC transporter permease subunit [Planctomycetota bacterium]
MSFSAAEMEALIISLRVALLSTAIVAIPGVFLGWLLAKPPWRGRALVDAVVMLPLVLPPVVVGWGLLMLLGSRSPFGIDIAFSGLAAAIAGGVVGLPLLIRASRIGFESVDSRLEDAARTLGMNRLQAFAKISLPLAAPAIAQGLILCLARSLGEFGATITFAGAIPGSTRTLPLMIHEQLQAPGGDQLAMRLVLFSALISLAAMATSEWLARKVRSRNGAQR